MSILNYYRHPKFRDTLIALALFAFAFFIRFYGGTWDTHVANPAYMSRQAEYIYSYGHPAVPDPFSSAPLYQPGMAYHTDRASPIPRKEIVLGFSEAEDIK